jgi:hypothetical protein
VARTQPVEGNFGELRVTADPTRPGLGRFAAVREQLLAARLMTLETMGLARGVGPPNVKSFQGLVHRRLSFVEHEHFTVRSSEELRRAEFK